MDYLRSSVNLRSYGGRDPFIEYRREGLRLFRALEENLAKFASDAVARVSATPVQVKPVLAPSGSGPLKKLGRNDVVTVTNGTETKELKFKKAEELIAQGWRIVEAGK